MNVKRYFGRTNKEAMAKLRAELGPDAVVVKNRSVEGGVEILAMADDPGHVPLRLPAAAPASRPQPGGHPNVQANVQASAHDVDRTRHVAAATRPGPELPVPEMSTVSFQQYVRDRLAQKAAPAPTLDEVLRPSAALAPDMLEAPIAGFPEPGARGFVTDAPAQRPTPVETVFDTDFDLSERVDNAAADAAQAQQRMFTELRDMRGFIADQLNSLAWFDGTRRNPVQARLLRQMITAGFSPALTRTVVSRLPADYDETQAAEWVRLALAKNLHCLPAGALLDNGGIFALVGPTGVGKTTSTAKIAARFALKHGTQSVGLISVDAYRIGGQDQLRSFGRLLGVPVHVAHDAATLADFLHLYMNKKLVLIDTAGIGQRDERVEELLASLSSSVVRKLVVLNATAQAETLDDVIVAYRATQAAGVVISKVDEAVKLGGVLDCAVRHRLKLVGVANGQRVPEDWIPPCAERLIESAFAGKPASAFDLEEREMGLMFLPEGNHSGTQAAEGAHA